MAVYMTCACFMLSLFPAGYCDIANLSQLTTIFKKKNNKGERAEKLCCVHLFNICEFSSLCVCSLISEAYIESSVGPNILRLWNSISFQLT